MGREGEGGGGGEVFLGGGVFGALDAVEGVGAWLVGHFGWSRLAG